MVAHPCITKEGLNNQTFLTPQVFDGLAGFQHGLSLSGVESHGPLLQQTIHERQCLQRQAEVTGLEFDTQSRTDASNGDPFNSAGRDSHAIHVFFLNIPCRQTSLNHR